MQNLQIQQNKQSEGSKSNLKQQYIFVVHGISCLFGWFVVLNSLDYFQSIYQKFDVYALFLLSVLIGYLIIVVAYKRLTSQYSIQKIISLGLIICTVALLLLLLCSLIFKEVPRFGFIISFFLCIVIGMSSNAVQLSYFAMINFVPEKVISAFTLGTAFSGLSLTILRMIITAIAGTKPKFAPILTYFVIASVVQIIDLFLNNKFCRSQFFIDKISPFMNRKSESRKVLNGDQSQPSQVVQRQSSFFRQLVAVNKKIFPYPLIIFLNYVITMMLFPDLTVKIKFGFSQVWSSLIFIFLFGLGDTIGKLLASFKGTFNRLSNHYLIVAKIVFFLIIPVLASGRVANDPLVTNPVFPFIVLFLFGLITGFILCSSVILISQKCQPADKQLSGVLSGIALQIGLITGTILAVPMQLIAPKQL